METNGKELARIGTVLSVRHKKRVAVFFDPRYLRIVSDPKDKSVTQNVTPSGGIKSAKEAMALAVKEWSKPFDLDFRTD